jgi:hypothetical protein
MFSVATAACGRVKSVEKYTKSSCQWHFLWKCHKIDFHYWRKMERDFVLRMGIYNVIAKMVLISLLENG